jgi:hypothetical protein
MRMRYHEYCPSIATDRRLIWVILLRSILQYKEYDSVYTIVFCLFLDFVYSTTCFGCVDDDHADGVRLRLTCGHQPAYCSPPPRGFMSWRNHGGMISTEENFWFIHHSSLATLPAESSDSKAEGTGKGNDVPYEAEYLFHNSKGYLTCRKIFRHGTGGFTLPPKEGVLHIFIVLRRVSNREPCVQQQAR